jgi:zinc/manganese transport system substrate-binding protein
MLRKSGLRVRILLGTAASGVAVLLLAGCAPLSSPSNPDTDGQVGAKPNRVSVVASVRVWADIAQAIGGKYVTATSVVHLASQDPHSYETTVRDQLAVNRADITITNGAGYDPFFAKLVANKPNRKPGRELDLAAGLKAAGVMQDPNPHLWYDFLYVQQLAHTIGRTEAAATSDPAAMASILARTAQFQAKVRALEIQQQALAKRVVGKSAIVTEAFASRLLRNLAIIDQTPVEFKNAVEQEQDASPKAMRLMQLWLTSHRIDLLLVNVQTAGSQTNQLISWAHAGGVPVLALGEVLPNGKHYLGWMQENLNQIARAVK